MEFVDILKEKNLPTWQESVLFKALEYQFIKTEQLDEAVKILSKYNGEDDFFYSCCDGNGLTYVLALASQI